MHATAQRRREGLIKRLVRACGWVGLGVGVLAGVATWLMADYGHSLMACSYESLSFDENGLWQCVTAGGEIAPPPELWWSVAAVVVAMIVWTPIGALLGWLARDSERLDFDSQGA